METVQTTWLWAAAGSGGACICLALALVMGVVVYRLMRPKKPPVRDIDGIAPAPARGAGTKASLTRIEDELAHNKNNPKK